MQFTTIASSVTNEMEVGIMIAIHHRSEQKDMVVVRL